MAQGKNYDCGAELDGINAAIPECKLPHNSRLHAVDGVPCCLGPHFERQSCASKSLPAAGGDNTGCCVVVHETR